MKPTLTPQRIDRAMLAAACAFEVPRRDIIRRGRTPAVSRARLALYAALYRTCATSYPELARYLRRDHSTILVGVRKAEDQMARDADYAAAVERIAEACR